MLNSSKQEVPAKNEIYTYFAVPIQALQALGGGQQLEPLAIILKTLPENNLQVINTNNILNCQDVPTESAQKNYITVDDRCLPKPQLSIENKPASKDVQPEKQEQELPTNKQYKCKICSKCFSTLSTFKKHMEEHSDKRKFVCDQCSASFSIETNLKLHKAIHSKGPLTCPTCNKTFQRTASLKCHLMLHQIDESFCCQECYVVFEKEEDLEKHMDKHKKEVVHIERSDPNIPLICSFCNYLFEDAGKYKEHVTHHIKVNRSLLSKRRLKRSSQKDYIHKCTVCSKSFPKMSLLDRHMRIHSGEKPYVCHICHRGFSQSGTLQIHITSRHEGLKPYKCELCPARFNQKGNLRVHLAKTHTAPPGERVYKCSHCTCIYKRVATLNGHIAKAHASEGAREVDDIKDIMEQLKALEQNAKLVGEKGKKTTESAQKESILPDQLKTEEGFSYVKLADSSVDGVVRRYLVKQKKIGDVRWYMCNYCVKEFKKPSDLIRHIRVHTREKPFKCSQCHQSFSLKSTLVSHIETHVGNKMCKCAVCEKSFASIRTLNVHMRKHEREKSQNQSDQYKCMACNQIFNSLEKAKIHMETHSGEPDQEMMVLKQPIIETVNGLLSVAAPRPRVPLGEMEQYRNRPFSCNQCSAVFKKMVHLKRHMLIHTGEKKFQCGTCMKSFYTSYALQEHTNFHLGVKKFACKICNKRFMTNSILKRHLITHTSHKPYICPYCKKRFKTVLICRKHIKTHKKEGKIFKGVIDQVVEAPEATDSSVVNLPLEELLKSNGVQNEPALNLEENIAAAPVSNVIQTGQEAQISQTETAGNFQTVENPTAIYITYEDLQTINSNLYQNTILPQLKLQLNIQQPTQSIGNPPEDTPNAFPTDIPLTTEVLTDLTPNIFLNLDGKFSNAFETAQPVPSNLLTDLESPKVDKQPEKFDSLLVDDQNLKLIAEANAALPEELNAISFTKGDDANLLSNEDDMAVDNGNENDKEKVEVETKKLSGGDGTKKEVGKGKMISRKDGKKKGRRKGKHETEFICRVCKKEFGSKDMLVKHSDTHKTKENICNFCGKIFKKPSDLTRHIRTHTGEKPYKCDKCDKSFSLKSTLESHFRTHNPVNPKEFNCNVCNSYFCSKASLKVHMMIHTDMKPYQCRYCSLKFRTSGHRKFHEANHSKNPGKITQSKNKPNVLASVALATETGPEDLANDGALLQSVVRQAISTTDLTPTIHIADNPTHAIQIDPSILQQLQAHGFLVQQDDMGEAPLSVIQVDDAVVTNVIVHDGGVAADSQEKLRRFECEICHKRYASRDVLTKHVKRHGKKAFRCEKCKVGLGNREELENHMKWHAGYRPYSCKFCTNCFGEERSLKTHMKRIHGQQTAAKDANIDLDFIFT